MFRVQAEIEINQLYSSRHYAIVDVGVVMLAFGYKIAGRHCTIRLEKCESVRLSPTAALDVSSM